ncbi:hypothetical protein DMH17_11445 [Raoultella planticola]|nr:hypothetical protein [Raoultella planticola]
MSDMIHKFKKVFPKARYRCTKRSSRFCRPFATGGDFAIDTDEEAHDLHVEPLFESEFVLVASKSRTCTGTTTLASLQNEQWVLCRKPTWVTTVNFTTPAQRHQQ